MEESQFFEQERPFYLFSKLSLLQLRLLEISTSRNLKLSLQRLLLNTPKRVPVSSRIRLLVDTIKTKKIKETI